MSVFVLLNRGLRFLIVSMVLLALWMVWERRERARPWLDLYVVWDEAGYRIPPPLSRTPAVVTRVVSENVLQIRDTNGVTWNVGLAGLGGVLTDGVEPRWRRFANQTRTNLTEQLVGSPVLISFTETQVNRTGMGFVYLGTNAESLALDLVSHGRLRWLKDSTRMLPLTEQAKLKGVDRQARKDQIGLWKIAAEGGP
ncbi:MAG: hypothetical protein RIS76_767 [Verrucomicrobiota bacterium]